MKLSPLSVLYNGNTSRLLSYQDIQDACYLNCAPSCAIQVGSSYNNTLSLTGSLFEVGLLTQRFIVSIPDYQRKQVIFSFNLRTGSANPDSIRAVLSLYQITGISGSAVTVTMWGYSGGAIATEWAAELQPSYALELNIEAATIGCTDVNLNNTVKTVNEGQYASLGVAALWGLCQAYAKRSGEV